MYRNVVVDIVEQPAELNTRFRYSCEGRTAGSILGVNSNQEKRTYPAIRVLNYTGAAVVVVSCVSKEAPFRPHPYGLVGKECCKGVCKIEFVTNESAPTVITFKNIGIQCCRKNDMPNMLTERESLSIDPFRTGFKHKNSYAEIDIFAVRLCFQVLLRPSVNGGDDKAKYRSISPVVSNPIFDKKYMSDLLIYDISDTTSPTDGGKKVMIFCDKIAKNDIKIRFYRTNANDSVEWEGWGEFKLKDIHHQYAIAFRTPPYVTKDIDNPVKVFLQLMRPSDGHRSTPIAFHYIPNVSNVNNLVTNKKRKIEQSKEFCDYMQTFEEQQRQSSKMKINIDPVTGFKDADKENTAPTAVSYESHLNLPYNQLHSYTQSYHPQPQPNYNIQQETNYLHKSNYNPQTQASQKPLEKNHFQQVPLNNNFLQQMQAQGTFQPNNQQRNFLQQSQPSGHLQQQALTDWKQNSNFQLQQQSDYPQQQPQASNFQHQQHQLPSSPYFEKLYSNSGYGGLGVNHDHHDPFSYYPNVEQQNSTHENLNQFCLNDSKSVNQQSTFEKNIVEDVENMSNSFNSLLLL